MPGCKGQHGMGGIEGWIELPTPGRWQLVGHGSPVGADEPSRYDLLPDRHDSRRPRHNGSTERFGRVPTEQAQRAETAEGPLAEDLDRLAAGTSE
jgi:hypothetical protein